MEKELVEHQPQVKCLREIYSTLLTKGHGAAYTEAEEKVHVIEKKLEQLLEQVSRDLVSLQRSQVSPLVALKLSCFMQTEKPCYGPAWGGRSLPLSAVWPEQVLKAL